MRDLDVTEAEEGGNKNLPSARHWLTEISIGKKYHEGKFWKEAKDAEDAYIASDSGGIDEEEGGREVQVFWANVQTLKPTVYNQAPKPDIRRRGASKDRIARASAQILENSTIASLDLYDFDYMAGMVTLDRLVAGRGVSRVYYDAAFDDASEEVKLTTKKGRLYDGEQQYQGGPESVKNAGEHFYYDKPYKKLSYERVECRYVHWKDFCHNKARNWSEVRWVGFRNYMTRDEVKKRFGKNIAWELNYTAAPNQELKDEIPEGEQQRYNKAKIWEIWDKTTRKVYWIAEGYAERALDVQDDPLGLREFFPCPRPLQGTVTSSDYLPRPDYAFYKDQCEVINQLTDRRAQLIDAIRVIVLTDKSEYATLENVFSDLATGPMIYPIENYINLQKKGGIQGAIQIFPLDVLVQALTEVDKAIAIEFQRLYEVAGIPDIMRGQTDPLETARAQKIKAQYSQRRVDALVRDVARYFKDVIALIAEVIAEQFEPATIHNLAGVESMQEQITPEEFDACIELLRDDVTRNYKLEIETDSTIALDEQQEKEAANEYLSVVTPFMEKTAAVMQGSPALGPVMAEILMAVSRRYKWGRGLEETIESAMQQVQQQAQQAMQAPPQPDPAVMKIQMESQAKQQQMQMEAQISQSKMQMEAQIEQAKQQMEFQFRDRELQTKEVEAQAKVQREQFESSAQVQKMRGELMATIQKLEGEIQKMRVESVTKAQELALKEREFAFGVEKSKAELELKALELSMKGAEVDKGTQAKAQQAMQRVARFMTDPATGDRMAVIQDMPTQ